MNGPLSTKLDFRHLQMLVALDDTRSVSKVADLLNVSQPAVSKALIALEADMNLNLFTRTIRGLEPTAQGMTLVKHARAILDDMMDAHDNLLDIKEGRVASLSVGVLPAAATTLVPRFIERLESESVSVTVNIQEGNMETLLPKLRSGEINFAVGNLPSRVLSSEFSYQFLYEDPLICVARKGHPILKYSKPTWGKIADYPLLLPPQSAYTRAAIDELLSQKGVVIPRRHVESFSTLNNIGVLQLTDSIGIVTKVVARHFASLDLLVPLNIPLPNICVQIGLIWVANRPQENAIRKVCRIFEEVVQRHISVN